MDELNMTDSDLKANGRPLCVTIFGVLNCVFGGLGIVSVAVVMLMWLGYSGERDQYTANPILSNLMNVLNLALSVYLLILGFGLLKMKAWARKWTIIYGWIYIIWYLIAPLTYLAAMAGTKMPMYSFLSFIMVQLSDKSRMGLAYPILLIIFMKTGKVREAFTARGGK